MEINQSAPLVAEHTITIQAPVEVVWRLLTTIDSWPRWHTGISRAQLDGQLAPGTVFRWTSGGIGITSTLQIVEPQQRIGWTGRAIGTDSQHIWRLQPTEGGTLITTSESMSGWMMRLMKLFAPGFLTDALQSWLTALKQAAEAEPH